MQVAQTNISTQYPDHELHRSGLPGDVSYVLDVNPFLWDLAPGLGTSTGDYLGAAYGHLNQPQALLNRRMRNACVHGHLSDHFQPGSDSTTISSSSKGTATHWDPRSAGVLGKESTDISSPHCRYNVMLPLVPHIKSFLSSSEACDLLDLYFTEPSNSLFSCASPYVITQIFRKDLFLKNERSRKTSKSLLAAMLWVTAQTSDASIFTDDPSARAVICDKLYLLCLDFMSSPKEKDIRE
jgi:hypothetical protein